MVYNKFISNNYNVILASYSNVLLSSSVLGLKIGRGYNTKSSYSMTKSTMRLALQPGHMHLKKCTFPSAFVDATRREELQLVVNILLLWSMQGML